MEILPSPAPAATRPAMPAPPRASAKARSAACEAMRIEWRELRADDQLVIGQGEIALAVPFGDAACLARSAAEPDAAHLALAEPAVAILPPDGRSIVAQQGGEMLVARFEAAAWSARSQTALGHGRVVREAFLGEDAFARGIAESLAASLRSAAGPAPAWLQSVGEDLALHLATRHGRPLEGAAPGLAPHRLQRVLALIDERLAQPIQVRELAAAVRMSPYHFARMFKQSTGQPPHVYITWLRMDRAKELLARTPLPLAQVATRVGYQTQAHFTGVFHARIGMTPRAYRLRSRDAQGVRASGTGARPIGQPAP